MGRLILGFLRTATVLLTVAVVMPHAMADDDVDQVRQLRSSESILPLSQILKKIESNYPGTLLDVDLEYEDGDFIYEIEVLDANHIVQELKIDARTGKILTEDDD